jgi:nucleotide-binding universal stress UspA family protein
MASSVIDVDQLAPPEAVPLGGSAFKAQRDEHRIANARTAAAGACSALEAAFHARSLTCAAQVFEGGVVDVLARQAQAVDLLVCGHTTGGETGEGSLLHSLLKHSPRPAIVVPPTASFGESVLVCYDGSTQAARALASFAHSGFAGSRTIYVLSLHHDLQQAHQLADRGASYLARHAIQSVPNALQLKHDVGAQILEEVVRVGAALIVMGAFGKNVAMEFLFGSVTRTILDAQPVPVFLDH